VTGSLVLLFCWCGEYFVYPSINNGGSGRRRRRCACCLYYQPHARKTPAARTALHDVPSSRSCSLSAFSGEFAFFPRIAFRPCVDVEKRSSDAKQKNESRQLWLGIVAIFLIGGMGE
jgi:hypothetical protein